jgi:hypothetical protein
VKAGGGLNPFGSNNFLPFLGLVGGLDDGPRSSLFVIIFRPDFGYSELVSTFNNKNYLNIFLPQF